MFLEKRPGFLYPGITPIDKNRFYPLMFRPDIPVAYDRDRRATRFDCRRVDIETGCTDILDVGLEISDRPVLMLEAKRFGTILRSTERNFDRTLEEKQLFRYARGKKIPYCILTNFERLHVFNADHERLILHFDDPNEYLSRLNDLLHLSPDLELYPP